MQFHLGKPILVMLVVSLVSAVVVARRSQQTGADLDLWVFADSHYKAFVPLVEEYQREHGIDINLNVVIIRAMNVRLASLFMTNPTSPDLPDLVEMEIGSIGRYFRAPLEDVGFLPLNDLLHESGWYDRIVEQRFAPWTKQGVIFGVPHDIHPVTITYRHDLYTEAGIDLPAAKTWPEFHKKCLQFREFWKRKVRYRHPIELQEAAPDNLLVMLQQRGINLVDDHNRLHFTDPKVAETLAFYAQMVIGPRDIAGQSTAVMGAFAKDLSDGNICAFITPDWRVTYIKKYAPELAGKMRMMPLPVFEPGDKRTGTWGGTMIGITRGCENPREAWRLIEKLYFSKEGLESRRKLSDILPPVKSLWDDPAYHQPDPYFGGQMANELFIELAREIPVRYVTPATGMAQTALNGCLTRATDYVQQRGTDGLEAACAGWLRQAQDEVRRRMDQMRFDE